MRKAVLLLALSILPAIINAEGSIQDMSVPVYFDEGDEVKPFAITCASTAWTAVVSSDTISRSVLYIAISTNTTTICLSTMTTVGYGCTDDTPGMDLVPGAAVIDNTRVAWNCRARQITGNADTRGKIKGRRSRDKGDYGNIRK